MKTIKQIRDEIRRIKTNKRWARTKKQVAIYQINGPLAIIQVSLEGQVRALEWVMEPEEETE